MQRIDILWRDIPSQVLIKRGRERGKYMLSARFQEAIDRAAMRADKGGSDAYLEEWRRVTNSIEAEGALEDIAQRLGKRSKHKCRMNSLRYWLSKRASPRSAHEVGSLVVYSQRRLAEKRLWRARRHPGAAQPTAKDDWP